LPQFTSVRVPAANKWTPSAVAGTIGSGAIGWEVRHHVDRDGGTILGHIRRVIEAEAVKGLTDADLLRRYAAERDESAFAALLGRHGRQVWRVCRLASPREQDAEDAFQATFLVLARRPGAVRKAGSVG